MNIIDLIKTVLCILIVGSHCIPLFTNVEANYYYGQWFFRFSVPFFFIASGYFFAKMDAKKKKSYIKRIFLIYCISSVIYLPFYLSLFVKGKFLSIGKNLILGYHHLWYLSALAIGLFILYIVDNSKFTKKIETCLVKNNVWGISIIIVILLSCGILLNVYYRLFDIPILNKIVDVSKFFGGGRNSLFFALPMLLIGRLVYLKENILIHQKYYVYIVLFLFLFSCGFAEAYWLKKVLGSDISFGVSLFGWSPAVPLFIICLSTKSGLSAEHSRLLRKIADVVYIIHVYAIELVRNQWHLHYMKCFIITLLISFAFSFVFVVFLANWKRWKHNTKNCANS